MACSADSVPIVEAGVAGAVPSSISSLFALFVNIGIAVVLSCKYKLILGVVHKIRFIELSCILFICLCL